MGNGDYNHYITLLLLKTGNARHIIGGVCADNYDNVVWDIFELFRMNKLGTYPNQGGGDGCGQQS